MGVDLERPVSILRWVRLVLYHFRPSQLSTTSKAAPYCARAPDLRSPIYGSSARIDRNQARKGETIISVTVTGSMS